MIYFGSTWKQQINNMEDIYNGILGWYFDLSQNMSMQSCPDHWNSVNTNLLWLSILKWIVLFSPCNNDWVSEIFTHLRLYKQEKRHVSLNNYEARFLLEQYLVLKNLLIDFLLFRGYTHIPTPHVTAFVYPWTVIVGRAICFTLAIHQVRRTWTLLFRFEHFHFRV